MTYEEIRELIQLVVSTGIAEVEVQRGDNRVWIRRSPTSTVTQEVLLPSGAGTTTGSHSGAPGSGALTAPAAAISPEPGGDPDLTDPSLVPVKSPIVGTFYEAGSPGAPSFVAVGDVIKPGKVLCIIESMKLMNEIESEVSGTIVKRLIDNGQPVEYGEVLFLVKPS